MDKLYIQELLDELAEAGVIRHNGCYRNGQPVYVRVPDEELSETAKGGKMGNRFTSACPTKNCRRPPKA